MSKRVFLTQSIDDEIKDRLARAFEDALFDIWQKGEIFEIQPDLIIMSSADYNFWTPQFFNIPILVLSPQWLDGASDCVPIPLWSHLAKPTSKQARMSYDASPHDASFHEASSDVSSSDMDFILASARHLLNQHARQKTLNHYTDIIYHHGLFIADPLEVDQMGADQMGLEQTSSEQALSEKTDDDDKPKTQAQILAFADEEDFALLEIQLLGYHHVFNQYQITQPEAIIIKDDLSRLSALASHPEAKNHSIFFWSQDKEKLIKALNGDIDGYIPHLAQAEPRITRQIEFKRRQRQQHHHLEKSLDMAAKDSLTQLYHRGCLTTHLPQMFKHALKAPKKGLALILLDLDRFKHINDHWGHDAGDNILRQVARQLQRSLRASDLLYRLGGEEFLAVLPDIEKISEAYRLAHRLCLAIRHQRFIINDEVVPITISAGVGIYHAGETPQSLLKRADLALYRAKKLGRDQAA